MRCKECIYCQGYSVSWCEKDNPNFDISKEVSCKDFEWRLSETQKEQDNTVPKLETTITIPNTTKLIDTDLLEEILSTFNDLNHKQVVYLATLNFKNQDRSETYALEEIDLDILIGKIKMVLK